MKSQKCEDTDTSRMKLIQTDTSFSGKKEIALHSLIKQLPPLTGNRLCSRSEIRDNVLRAGLFLPLQLWSPDGILNMVLTLLSQNSNLLIVAAHVRSISLKARPAPLVE